MARRREVGPSVSFFAFQDIITAVVGIFILITLILVLELAQRVEAASADQREKVGPIVEAIEGLEVELQRLRSELRKRSENEGKSAPLNAFNRAEKIDQLRARLSTTANRLDQTQSQMGRVEAEMSQAETVHERLLIDAADLEVQRRRIEQLTAEEREVQKRLNRLASHDSAVYRDQTDQDRNIVLVTLSGEEIELRDATTRSAESMQGPDRLDRMREWLGRIDLDRRQLFLLIEPGGAADFAALQEALQDSGAVYGFSVAPPSHSIRMSFEMERSP